MPTVVALTARSADRSASSNAGSSSATAAISPPMSAKRSASAAAPATVRLPMVTRRAPRLRQANTTAWAAPPAPATTTSVPASDRPIASSARLEPRRVAVEADEPPVGRLHDVVHRPDPLGIKLDLVAQARDNALVGGGHAEPEPVRPRAASTAPSTTSGLELEQLVVRIDPGRREGRVVHDLRMASSERLPDQGDPLGHRSAGAMRRTGPAVAGNVTFGMISSTQCWSCAGSGVIVCRTKYSTPASTRAWSEAMTSSGVPNR